MKKPVFGALATERALAFGAIATGADDDDEEADADFWSLSYSAIVAPVLKRSHVTTTFVPVGTFG